jgi:hypothetical protein
MILTKGVNSCKKGSYIIFCILELIKSISTKNKKKQITQQHDERSAQLCLAHDLMAIDLRSDGKQYSHAV